MRILHLLRSEPDGTVEKITDVMSEDNTTTVVSLYEEAVDWSALVDQIFENDRVICWW
ncbi:hypothetical protein [Desulfatitalea tepidiphila]|uniref:hypothetical protein n=1 Tax=Desulfatitalea tepidiphila TaxID=1185843 RepID=UPI001379374F|nr:hypothetical protein [Desulfatitalea tepidiphila]